MTPVRTIPCPPDLKRLLRELPGSTARWSNCGQLWTISVASPARKRDPIIDRPMPSARRPLRGWPRRLVLAARTAWNAVVAFVGFWLLIALAWVFCVACGAF